MGYEYSKAAGKLESAFTCADNEHRASTNDSWWKWKENWPAEDTASPYTELAQQP
jgi:hypothetical protein